MSTPISTPRVTAPKFEIDYGPSRWDLSKYLLAHRFQDFEKVVSYANLRDLNPDAADGRKREIIAYAKDLSALSDMDLEKLFYQKTCEANERIERELDIAMYYLEQPTAYAALDAAWWARLPFWSNDECACILLGRDPRRVNKTKLELNTDKWKLARDFRDLRDLVDRAQQMKQLPEVITPSDFVEWAEQIKLPLPPGLREALDASPTAKSGMQSRLDALQAENASLKQGIAAEQLETRERTSLLTLVVGMAVAYAGHQPEQPRNSTARIIAEKLYKDGYRIDESTVRKYLNEAAEKVRRD
jgi:hypothetical protein